MRFRSISGPKVPEITAMFWVLKLLTTCIGETTADFLSHDTSNLAATICFIAFAAALVWQLAGDRYHPVRYWLAVLMVAVVGTGLADGPRFILGIPFFVNAIGYALVLAGLFAWWYASESTLSIHSIHTRRREVFYWSVVLITFSLGTALGDTTATDLGLGYLASIFLFGGLFLVPLIAWRLGGNAILCFWASYTMTRPTGASISDWLAFDHTRGGLGLGTGPVSAAGLAIFAILLAAVAARTPRTRRARSDLGSEQQDTI